MILSDDYLTRVAAVAVQMSGSTGRAERVIANWQADWFSYLVRVRVV